MLLTLNSQLLHHRRKVLSVLAALAVAGVALTANAASMSTHSHEDIGAAVTACMTVGACLLVVGVSAVAVRRLLQRPLWLVAAPLLPALPFAPAPTWFLARAGPAPPSLLQVFRL
jgi:hypothetical protein